MSLLGFKDFGNTNCLTAAVIVSNVFVPFAVLHASCANVNLSVQFFNFNERKKNNQISFKNKLSIFTHRRMLVYTSFRAIFITCFED